MKTNKNLTFVSLGALAIATIGAYAYTNGANAQGAVEPAAPKTSNIPRHIGTLSAGLANAVNYTPSCPAYVFPMDAAAIQESRSRAFVEAEVIRFRSIREGMDNYEDCLVENARRDIDVISGKLSAYLTAEAGKEAANYTALGDAARANADRIRGGGSGGAAKKKKGDTAAAPADTGVFVSTYRSPGRWVDAGAVKGTTVVSTVKDKSGQTISVTTVTRNLFGNSTTRTQRFLSNPGNLNDLTTTTSTNNIVAENREFASERRIGSFLAGTAESVSYSSPCGAFLGEVSVANFNTVRGSAAFNSLVDYLQNMPTKIEEYRACRNENTNEDYDAVQEKIQDGVNAIFVPVKSNFDRQYNLVNAQLNLHRQAGGLLAAPSTPRPKAPAPSKAKKKPR